MTSPACDWIRDGLPRAVARGLDAPGAEAVRAHLADCPDCRAEAELLRDLRRQVTPVPDDLRDRVVDAVVERLAVRRQRMRRWPFAAAIAALLGGAALVRVSVGPFPETAAVTEESNPLVSHVLGALWATEDAILARGGLLLDELSEAELEILLAELDP